MPVRNLYEQSHIPRTSFPYNLQQTVSDALFISNPERYGLMPGMEREFKGFIGEHSLKSTYAHGKGIYAWVCNRAEQSADLSRGALCRWYTKDITATGGTTSTIVCAGGTFTADEEAWNFVAITDNNNAAGAAPETEGGYITKNTATTLTVRTPLTGGVFSAAVEANDTASIRSDCMVIAAAIGDQYQEVAGIVMASTLAYGYWGWICLEADWVWALVKAGTAITADDGLIADTGRLNISGGAVLSDLMMAYAPIGFAADIVSDLIPVRFKRGPTTTA